MSRHTSKRFTVHATLIGSLALVVVAAAGCFESEYPVSERQAGKVDLKFVGDWMLGAKGAAVEAEGAEGSSDTARLVIRNLHNDEYYVEWAGSDTPEAVERATGHLTEVKGVMFASIQRLTPDGKVSDVYWIFRINRQDDDTFSVKNLDGSFFKNKKIGSSEDLRKIIAESMENDAMFKGDELVATREVAAEKK